MRNCLILGSGRSGTSLLAGSLARAGYHVGHQLVAASEANPTGFFEDREVNDLNEMLLAQVTPARPPGAPPPEEDDDTLWGPSTLWGWRWLAPVPLGTEIARPDVLDDRMGSALAVRPFALKDPRFCLTLDAWRPLLPDDTAFLCVFREPARTAQSIVRVGAEGVYLHGYQLDFAGAVELWTLAYRHALAARQPKDDWLFVHFDQLLGGAARDPIEALLGRAPDLGLADPSLKRSPAEGDVGSDARALYAELCELAGYPGRADYPA